MASDPTGEYFIYNGQLIQIAAFVYGENEGGVYEVLRVLNGKALFLEDHLRRFYRSAEIAGIKITYSEREINRFLQILITENKIAMGNVLLSAKERLKAFFIPHSYPSVQDYNNGVQCGLLHAERVNPNAKVFHTTVRERANRMIAKEGFYEVLLVDHDETITEGSKSNVFFVRGERIFTPPSQKVLLGITRLKTIECARKLGIEVVEKEVSVSELEEFDSIFITGTSPKLLPVKQIGDKKFDTGNSILRRLMATYDQMISDYIEGK